MKTKILFGAALAFMGLAAAPLFAQTGTTTTSYVQSSTIIGSKIKDARGQDVGEIKDIVLDRSSGCLAYVVLSTHGGGTSTATKTVAAPWTVFSPSSEPRVYMTRVEREKIYSAPVWESTRIEEYSRPEYISQVYGYYGMSVPSTFGVSATSTTTGTTTTNSAASTSASTSPAATASAAATMTPVTSASPNATTTPATKASPSPHPAMTASPSASARSSKTTRSPAPDNASSPKSKSTSEKKSSSKKSEANTEASPASESTTTENASESPSAKSKKSSRKKASTEKPETDPTPEG
jgi:sporulation protein YlmC with PRC-barrel domain